MKTTIVSVTDNMSLTSCSSIRPAKLLFILALFFTLWPTLRFSYGSHTYYLCVLFCLLDVPFFVSASYRILLNKYSVKEILVFAFFIFFTIHSANFGYFFFKFSLMLYLAYYFYNGFNFYSMTALKYSFYIGLAFALIQFIEANFVGTSTLSMNNWNFHFGYFETGSHVGESYATLIKGLSIIRVSGLFEEPAHFVTALLILFAIFYREKPVVFLIFCGFVFSFSGITFFSFLVLTSYIIVMRRFSAAWCFLIICLAYIVFSAVSFYLVPMEEFTNHYLSWLDRILGFFYWQQGTVFEKIFGYGGVQVCSSNLPENLLRLSPEYMSTLGVCLNGEYSSIGSILQDYGVFALGMIFLFLHGFKFNQELKLLVLLFILSVISFSYYAWPPLVFMFLGYILYRYRVTSKNNEAVKS